jgi:hypothetical protein
MNSNLFPDLELISLDTWILGENLPHHPHAPITGAKYPPDDSAITTGHVPGPTLVSDVGPTATMSLPNSRSHLEEPEDW